MDSPTDRALAYELVLDELFDLMCYQELERTSKGPTRDILRELIPVETRHLAFWKDFFKIPEAKLDFLRQVKLRALVAVCRFFGPAAVHLALEAIEIYGIRKYLAVWERYKNGPLGEAVKGVLKDEFEHEDAIVSGASRPTLRPADVRSIFLGLNDGLVEILGAVSGFFAAFSQPRLVLMAGSSVAVAGAISMAAGAYVASSSELEVVRLEQGKAAFLGGAQKRGNDAHPLRSAALVGLSYFLGALVPILPVVLGARTLAAPLATAALVLLLVSMILAFLSGMEMRRRALTNLLLMSLAAAVTYGMGILARNVWGVVL